MKKDNREIVLSAKEIVHTFNNGQVKTPVLKGVNLDIHEGEFVSIMGPSGSGKSTLLYILSGLLTPTEGEVQILNKDILMMNNSKISDFRRSSIGFVFQFYNLVQNLTVKENILLPLIMDGKRVKDYEGRLQETLEIVGLKDKQNFYSTQLSGGQQQRVAIARAIINKPKLIFADEPIGNLDSVTGEAVMELFRTICKEEKITIFQVTHSYESALYGHRIVYMKDGVIDREEIVESEGTNAR
ncbi:TPA: ABC transporter ATP-binding protein [Streptococcus suis]